MENMGLNVEQIRDSAIIEEDELASGGVQSPSYSGPFTIISVVSSTKIITLDSTGYDGTTELSSERISHGDIIVITEGSAAGTYTVNQIINETSFSVNESIPNASSGSLSFYYPSACTKIGKDIISKPNTFRSNNLEQILNDLDEENDGGYSEITYTNGVFVSKITVWNSVAKNKKRSEINYTYSSSPFVSQVIKNIYNENGDTIIATITTDISYSNGIIVNINSVVTRP